MIVFSITYVLSAIIFYRHDLGDASLVYANIINLCARIVYCLIFIKRYFGKSGLPPTFVRRRFRDALPSWQLWTACVFSAVLVHASEQRLKANAMALQLGRRALMGYSVLLHLVVGISLALICLATWWKTSGQKLNLPINSKKQMIYEKTS
jgi:oligosaccharide translocation protein RFT1